MPCTTSQRRPWRPPAVALAGLATGGDKPRPYDVRLALGLSYGRPLRPPAVAAGATRGASWHRAGRMVRLGPPTPRVRRKISTSIADGLLHVGDGDALVGRVLVLRADADHGHLDAVVVVDRRVGEAGDEDGLGVDADGGERLLGDLHRPGVLGDAHGAALLVDRDLDLRAGGLDLGADDPRSSPRRAPRPWRGRPERHSARNEHDAGTPLRIMPPCDDADVGRGLVVEPAEVGARRSPSPPRGSR